MKRDTVLVVDFGGQYAHRITTCVRNLGVYAEPVSPQSPLEIYFQPHVKGVILSGGPSGVHDPNRPPFAAWEFFHTLAKPVLGICYGHQLMADSFCGEDCSAVGSRDDEGEYGPTELTILEPRSVLEGLQGKEQVLMSHRDCVDVCPPGFSITAKTAYSPCAAMEHEELPFFGVQFHPEVADTPCGMKVLENFLGICGAKHSWTADEMRKEIIANACAQVGHKSVLLLYSGGADSSVTLALLKHVVPSHRLHVAIVDTGLLRKDEAEEIHERLARWMQEGIHRTPWPLKAEERQWLASNVRIIRAEKMFLEALRDVYDPEEKRQRISDCFALVAQKALRNAARGRGGMANWLLAQGTIYPDTIESGGTAHSARIKTHHNAGVPGSIIQKMRARRLLLEPLIPLYKDDVRVLGKELGVPLFITERQPFPGPGLAVRILCYNMWPLDKTLGAAMIVERGVQDIADAENMRSAVLPLKSVGVQGDERTYAFAVALDGNAEWDALCVLAQRITNAYRGVINRVLWRVSPRNSLLRALVVKRASITKERTDLLKEVDSRVMRALRLANWQDQMWQFPVVLAPLGYAGTDESIILRPVNSLNAMTATPHRLPPALLENIVHALTELPGVHDVFYDITGKPPGTIEWE